MLRSKWLRCRRTDARNAAVVDQGEVPNVEGILFPGSAVRILPRNAYRAIKDEAAADPLPGSGSQVAQRTYYMILPEVAAKILDLTKHDPT